MFHIVSKINFSQRKKNPSQDQPCIKLPSEIPAILTKRMCLGQVNGIYDPLGLLAPITVKAKILLRKMWGLKLGWDDVISDEMRQEWLSFFAEVTEAATISFKRCIRPNDADPMLQNRLSSSFLMVPSKLLAP